MKGRFGLGKLLLIQATAQQTATLHEQLLAAATATLRLPGCMVCQLHASRRSARHWIMRFEWLDQQALQLSIDKVLEPLLQQLFDSGALSALQVFGGPDAFPPADVLDDVEPI
ncbi:hypothetical protein [Pseudomonas sp. UBA7530]|uniref:hypothetical protein n=1 Tax=Pseudomonas sp. UBA7530 TaxID=1947341 RepID=UPI0025FEEDBE|nr:hypothetical protein [Pseudomonas sp. UBA7530]